MSGPNGIPPIKPGDNDSHNWEDFDGSKGELQGHSVTDKPPESADLEKTQASKMKIPLSEQELDFSLSEDVKNESEQEKASAIMNEFLSDLKKKNNKQKVPEKEYSPAEVGEPVDSQEAPSQTNTTYSADANKGNLESFATNNSAILEAFDLSQADDILNAFGLSEADKQAAKELSSSDAVQLIISNEDSLSDILSDVDQVFAKKKGEEVASLYSPQDIINNPDDFTVYAGYNIENRQFFWVDISLRPTFVKQLTLHITLIEQNTFQPSKTEDYDTELLQSEEPTATKPGSPKAEETNDNKRADTKRAENQAEKASQQRTKYVEGKQLQNEDLKKELKQQDQKKQTEESSQIRQAEEKKAGSRNQYLKEK